MSKEHKTTTIEELFKQIEELIEKMEDGQTGLEELFVMYKEGCELLKNCNASIEKVEKEIIDISNMN